MTKLGRYRYWGDQKPDTSRPLLTFTRNNDAVAATSRTDDSGNAPSTSGTLRVYGPIDSWGGFWGVSSKEVAQALDLLGDAEQIVVRVNSPGGESSEGRAIMNLLRAHKAKCIGVVDGAAYSAASYVAVGCEETVMSPGTTLMIHDTSTFAYGNAEEMRKVADRLELISASGAELYAEIAGGTVEEWRDRQRAETWYTAASAVEAGLADRVAVVPDAGPAETAGDDGPEPVDPDGVEDRAQATYDLSLFENTPKGLPQAAQTATNRPPNATAAVGSNKEGAGIVELNDQQIAALREQVGFAEDADPDTILAAVTEALNERAETDSSNTNTAEVPEGMTLIETDVLTQLRDGAQAGIQARQQQRTEERDRTIEAAIAAGKTTPARREHWQNAWDADPDGTRQVLDKLEAGLVPTEDIGTAPAADTDDDGWFPQFAGPASKEA